MWNVCIEPYCIAADAVLRFTKKNICSRAEKKDISFTPRNADISICLVRCGIELNTDAINRSLSADMPEYDGIGILNSAYTECGYVNFSVSDAFMFKCAERINSEFTCILKPEIIELPESPEYAVMKLMNFVQLSDEFPFSGLNRRALWLCLGLAGNTDKTILKRRLHAAAAASVRACSAQNAALGGIPALAMAKLISFAVDKLKGF